MAFLSILGLKKYKHMCESCCHFTKIIDHNTFLRVLLSIHCTQMILQVSKGFYVSILWVWWFEKCYTCDTWQIFGKISVSILFACLCFFFIFMPKGITCDKWKCYIVSPRKYAGVNISIKIEKNGKILVLFRAFHEVMKLVLVCFYTVTKFLFDEYFKANTKTTYNQTWEVTININI